jgi:biopolymer transport protein ExbB
MISKIINAVELGGILMYPLLILGLVALAITIDKILLYKRLAKLPKNLADLIENHEFSCQEFEENIKNLPSKNYYYMFFTVILKNRNKPIWFLESSAVDKAKLIEKSLNSSLWILETITTVAPLLGLLGTIIGMMDSFKLIGDDTLINPSGVTAGVAEALIATACGLVIAVISLFSFNYFSRQSDEVLDEMERLGTRIIDNIRLSTNLL